MRFQREELRADPHYERIDKDSLIKANIGRRYWKNNRLTDLPDESYQSWGKLVLSYVEQMHVWEQSGSGLLLVGDYGRGKTTAACRVLMEAMSRGPIMTYFIRADDLDWAARHRDEVTPEGTRVWDLVTRGAQFLVLDDLGAERKVDWNARWVEHVLSVRYDWQLPTIITSNIELDALYEMVPRLRHFAGDSYQVVEVKGPNLRGQ